MRGLGEGVAFAGLCVGLGLMSAWGEEPPVLLWAFALLWALWSDWGQKGKN